MNKALRLAVNPLYLFSKKYTPAEKTANMAASLASSAVLQALYPPALAYITETKPEDTVDAHAVRAGRRAAGVIASATVGLVLFQAGICHLLLRK